jgi:hypothetical protein
MGGGKIAFCVDVAFLMHRGEGRTREVVSFRAGVIGIFGPLFHAIDTLPECGAVSTR